MRKQVYELDENNYLYEIYVAEIDESGAIVDSDKQGFITIDPSNTLYRPKWNGDEWIEGETQQEREERDSNAMLESLKPTQKELADADLEIKILTLLLDMGVI